MRTAPSTICFKRQPPAVDRAPPQQKSHDGFPWDERYIYLDENHKNNQRNVGKYIPYI